MFFRFTAVAEITTAMTIIIKGRSSELILFFLSVDNCVESRQFVLRVRGVFPGIPSPQQVVVYYSCFRPWVHARAVTIRTRLHAASFESRCSRRTRVGRTLVHRCSRVYYQ